MPGKLCAVYSIYNEAEFIILNLNNVYPYVDRILVLINEHPWAGTVGEYPPDGTQEMVRNYPDPQNKIEVWVRDWQDDTHGGQLAQRTFGMGQMDEGDWYWLLDGDEFTPPEMVPVIRKHIKNTSADCLQIYFYTLWQSFHWVSWCEWMARLFRVKSGARFVAPNTMADPFGKPYSMQKIPREEMYTFHAGYVRSDARMREKIEIYGQRSKRGDFYPDFDPEAWWAKYWIGWRSDPAALRESVHPVRAYRGRIGDNDGPFRLPSMCQIPEAVREHPYYFDPDDRSVSIVTVTYRSSRPLARMLETFVETVDPEQVPVEFIWIDNNSPDVAICYELFEQAARKMDAQLTVIRNDKNLFFTKATNQGIEASRKRHIMFLNPDCEFESQGWLLQMIEDLEAVPNAGIVGCKMMHRDGTVHHVGGYFQGSKAYHIGRDQDDLGQFDERAAVEWVTGACLMLKREVLVALGLLEERYKHYESDNKYCIAAWQAGFQVIYSPAEIIHDAGKSVQEPLETRNP